MTDQTPEVQLQPHEVNTEELSTNFYWLHTVEGQSFNLQTTVRGNPSHEAVAAHLKAAFTVMWKIVKGGGNAKQVGKQAAPVTTQVVSVTPPAAGYQWRMNGGAYDTARGKLHLILSAGAAEPENVPCPIHPGKTFKRRTNDRGSWLSHKEGEGYCSAAFEASTANAVPAVVDMDDNYPPDFF